MTVKILSRITVTNSLPTLKIRDYFAVYLFWRAESPYGEAAGMTKRTERQRSE
jgi:hypothetical protein